VCGVRVRACVMRCYDLLFSWHSQCEKKWLCSGQRQRWSRGG